MYQGGRLKRMVRPFAPHVLGRYLLKLRIDQRGQSGAGITVAELHLLQQESDLIRQCFAHNDDECRPILSHAARGLGPPNRRTRCRVSFPSSSVRKGFDLFVRQEIWPQGGHCPPQLPPCREIYVKELGMGTICMNGSRCPDLMDAVGLR